MAESGRFMTKCVIFFRCEFDEVSGAVAFAFWASACCRRSFNSFVLLNLGPVYGGKGSESRRSKADLMNSLPSSQDGRTRSATYNMAVRRVG